MNNNPLGRITVNPEIFGGKPIIRGVVWRWNMSWRCSPRDTPEVILSGYPWLESEDIQSQTQGGAALTLGCYMQPLRGIGAAIHTD